MRPRTREFLNCALFLLIQVLIAGLQTSVWPQFAPAEFAPPIWTVVILYFAFFRSRFDGIAICYGTVALLTSFSAISFAMFSLLILSLFFTARFFKGRIFWSSASYTTLAASIAVIVIYVYHWIFSHIAESNPISGIPVINLCLQILLAPFLAVPLFALFKWIDFQTIPDIVVPTESTL